MTAEKIDAEIEEIDVTDPDAPASVRRWGSPTILVDGKDVAEQKANAA